MKKCSLLLTLAALLPTICSCDTGRYILNITNDDETKGSVTGAGSYKFGQSVTIKCVPNQYYDLASIKDSDGNFITTRKNYTFEMPKYNLDYTVYWKNSSYELTLKQTNAFMAYTEGQGKHEWGSIVSIKSVNFSLVGVSYLFVKWIDEDTQETVATTENFDYEMPKKDITLVAIYNTNN